MIELELRLTSAAAQADAPPLPFQVAPAAHQLGLGVGKLREFHLQLPLKGAGPLGEDVDDQFRAAHHPAAERLLQVALLARREVVVDHQHVGALGLDELANLIDLAGTDQPTGVLPPTPRGHLARQGQAGGSSQLRSFSDV